MLNVREKAPLRLYCLITTPSGRTYRWGEDERRAEDCFSGLTFSTVMPGGFESCDLTLPRKAGIGYQDMERLSTLQVKSAGCEVAGEFRLEKTPRVSDLTERSIAPQLVGWQAHLEDDPEAMEVYVDRDLTHWIPASNKRKINLYTFFTVVSDPSVDADTTTGIPALNVGFQGTGGATGMTAEAYYDAGPGATIASIYYDMISQGTLAAYLGEIGTASDDIATASSMSSDLLTGTNSSASGTHTPSPATYRWGLVQIQLLGGTPTEADHTMMWRRLTVWGNHGLTKRGTAPNDGLLASDIVANAVSRWAPRLQYGGDTVLPSAFTIPQMEFRDPTTVADVITQASRFELPDWAVWENPFGPAIHPTFYYNPRSARGNRWRARVRPSNLTETGPQVDRLWNGVIVTYQDVDGSTKTVGPTGSRTDAQDPLLIDTDPLNPINQLGMKRYNRLDMGETSTSAGAIKVGATFLARAKDLDQSGSAELVGHVEDDAGHMQPAHRVRAGDQIAFVDSSDHSYRRIVHTSYDHDTRTISIDLDSPPEGMDALLEQLGVSLTVGTSASAPAPSGAFLGGPPYGF